MAKTMRSQFKYDGKTFSVIPRATATRVIRNGGAAWEWPAVAQDMVSDSHKVQGATRTDFRARNGDPLTLAYAVNFIESLYRCGYVIAQAR